MVEHSQPRLSLTLLLDLSRDLSDLLVPVRLRPEFRTELQRRLMIEARRQQALRTLALTGSGAGAEAAGLPSAPEASGGMMSRLLIESGPANHRWIIGAAVGSASLLGLLVLVRSRRHRSAA